jgi:hypothetical protein
VSNMRLDACASSYQFVVKPRGAVAVWSSSVVVALKYMLSSMIQCMYLSWFLDDK